MSGAMKQECGRKLKEAADALRSSNPDAANALDAAGEAMIQSEVEREKELKKFKKKDE